MAILRYGGLDASLERAKRKAPAPYAAAYDWFVAHRNEVGPRPYGAHAPKDVELRLAAQRGIHKPGSYKYAISVTATGYETYQQDAIHYLDDDTWVLLYSEHRHSTGAKAGSPVYNKSLCLCLQAGLPVGVVIKESNSLELGG